MLNATYVLGLVDGKGQFKAGIRHKKKVLKKLNFSLDFSEDDRKMAYEIKKFFRCGKIYKKVDKGRQFDFVHLIYEVKDRKEILEKIIPFFEKNDLKLPSIKADFEMFKKIAKS